MRLCVQALDRRLRLCTVCLHLTEYAVERNNKRGICAVSADKTGFGTIRRRREGLTVYSYIAICYPNLERFIRRHIKSDVIGRYFDAGGIG